jgi:hypothetical protein
MMSGETLNGRKENQMLNRWAFIVACLLVASQVSAADIPYVKALDASAISQEKLAGSSQHALLLGNGDINALLFASGRNLVLRLTKNDVWDARLETSNDPPLPTLKRIKELAAGEWKNRGRILPEGYKDKGTDGFHAKPYPCPRPCADLQIGGGPDAAPDKLMWKQHRAQGAKNSWRREGDGKTAVMSIQGGVGSSNGWNYGPISVSTDKYPKLRVRLSGSANAKYFVQINGRPDKAILSSQWIKSPATSSERVFELPAGQTASRIVLYTWTTDGKVAENRFEAVTFEGTKGKIAVDLSTEAICGPKGGGPARLDLRNAVASVGAVKDGPPAADVRALAGRNVFLIASNAPARLKPISLSLTPEPTTGRTDGVDWVAQTFPGDGDWPGMSHAVALAQNKTHKAVAIVTSLEAKDPVAAAVKLAADTLAVSPAKIIAQHQADWRKFWSASGIDIDDPTLRDLWYRNLYFLRCVSRPGAECVGLYASLVSDKSPMWHGNHTMNYNAQQAFWSAFSTNHVELAEPYCRFITEYLPRARWLCRKIFDFDGAYIPHVLLQHEPPDPSKCRNRNNRQYFHHVWGMTIGVSGFAVQNLWLQYKYAPNRKFLEKTAYPAVRDVALFYTNFIAQCKRGRGGKVVLAPSISPEHWGWTPKFERNRDCTFDIAYARYTLQAAIDGAGILRRDEKLVKRFKEAIALLPPYPTTTGEKPVVVDVAGAPPITYNIAVPATPVCPADVVTWLSPPKERKLFTRTIASLKWNGNNSSIMLPIARARLGMEGAAEYLKTETNARLRPNGMLGLNRLGGRFNAFGHYTEQFGAAMAVTELLIQSAGDVIRVFPAWPEDKNAAFENLRTQGGFLVSSSIKAGKIASVAVVSTVGGKLRMLSPWAAIKLQNRDAKPTALKPDNRGIIELTARPGQKLIFLPG